MAQNRVIHDKNNPYTLLNTSIAFDKAVTGLGKALWLYAFSRPNDWIFYTKEMIKHFSEGRDAVRAALKSLEAAGYLNRHQERLPCGKMGKVSWTWYEVSQIKLPQPEMPGPDNAGPANPTLPITNKLNTERMSVASAAAPLEKKSERNLADLDQACHEAGSKNACSSSKPPSSCTILDHKGVSSTVKLEDVFRICANKGVSWPVTDITYAWEALCSYTGVIGDWWRFMEGTVENYQRKQKSNNAVNARRSSKRTRKPTASKSVNSDQKPAHKDEGEPIDMLAEIKIQRDEVKRKLEERKAKAVEIVFDIEKHRKQQQRRCFT